VSTTRSAVDVHPLTPDELHQEEDAHWALHDSEVQDKYVGQCGGGTTES
jgi:hypothetical protein